MNKYCYFHFVGVSSSAAAAVRRQQQNTAAGSSHTTGPFKTNKPQKTAMTSGLGRDLDRLVFSNTCT